MQHAFQIVSRAPAPAGLSRHDFLESLLAVLIPFAYVVWKHSHPPMTGVLAALGCGAVFILGKVLFRQYAGQSALNYYISLRVEAAKSMMRSRRHSYSEIAVTEHGPELLTLADVA